MLGAGGLRPRLVAAGFAALLAAAVLSIWLRLHNDAFVDEATYVVAGRLLLAKGAAREGMPDFATYFSGAPFLYPPMAAIVDGIGGLAAVRVVSLACILLAAAALHDATRTLFDDRGAGLAAASLFLIHAPTLLLAKLGTYDAPSLAMLAVALSLGARAGTRRSGTLVGAAGASAAIAVGLKYAALLYVPFIAVIAIWSRPRRWERAALRPIALYVAAVACVLSLLLLVGGAGDIVAGFRSTTLTRVEPTGTPTADIVSLWLALGGAAIALAIPTMLAPRPTTWIVAIALFAAGVVAPINHARLHESVSLHKHVAFGTLFLAPLAGRTVARSVRALGRYWQARHEINAFTIGSLLAVLVALVIVRPAVQGAETLYAYWPRRTAEAYRVMATAVRPGGRYLSEDPDLGPYYLRSTRYGDWSNPYYLAGSRATATPPPTASYVRAVQAGAFDAVILRFGRRRAWALAIDSALAAPTSRYRKAASLLFTLADGPGVYEVWLRAPR